MTSTSLRVAYVSTHNPHAVGGWSGLVHFIYRAVARQPGVDVVPIGPLQEPLFPLVRARQAWYRYAKGERHLRDHDPLTLASWGWSAARRARALAPDVILSPGFGGVGRMRTNAPIVTYTDATFADVADRYPTYSGLSQASHRNGERLARWAAKHVSVLCFSSPHASRSMVEVYGADPERIRTIPFGANLVEPPCAAEARAALDARETARQAGAPVRFLFLGVDWVRKGGDLAVEVVAALRERGVNAVLDVAGCTPPPQVASVPWVKPAGFMSKTHPEGRAALARLLAGAHFLLLPTMAESFGVVFCEANAYAVPNLTRRIDGVPVWDGENGYAFPPTVGPNPYVETVVRLLDVPGAYEALSVSSRAVYERQLNWDVAGAALVRALEDAVRLRRPTS